MITQIFKAYDPEGIGFDSLVMVDHMAVVAVDPEGMTLIYMQGDDGPLCVQESFEVVKRYLPNAVELQTLDDKPFAVNAKHFSSATGKGDEPETLVYMNGIDSEPFEVKNSLENVQHLIERTLA